MSHFEIEVIEDNKGCEERLGVGLEGRLLIVGELINNEELLVELDLSG